MTKEEIILQHLTVLKKFISDKDIASCKNYLEALDISIKGNVFEHFLADLYQGNGFHVQLKGGRGDKGADLLVKKSDTAEEIAFIIQAKNHKQPLNKKDTFSELHQFRSETVKEYKCKHYRLISLNGFVSDAYDYQGKGWIALYNWKHIEELFSDYDAITKRKPSVDLAKHNKQTYEEVNRLMETNKRISLLQATGTGKSYLIYQLFANNPDKKKLLIAPSKYIIEQFQNNEKYGWLMDDVKTIHYQNRQQFLNEHLEKQKYDFIILDEFHRTGAKTYEPKVLALLAHNPDAFVFGATATPVRSDGEDMNEKFEFEAASNISLPQAIIKEYIPNPTYVASLIDLEQEIDFVKNSLEKSKNPNLDKVAEAKKLDDIKLNWKKSNGVDKVLKQYLGGKELRNFIVFCEDIDILKKYKHRVSDWFVEAGFSEVEPFTVNSKRTDKENDEALSSFEKFSDKNKIALLFAVDMFNEGLHIKNVDGVVLLRKTTSHIVFYQQIGRCLQVGSKSPIIFDLVNNFATVAVSNFLNDLNTAKEQEQKELADEGLDDDTPTFHVYDETKDIRAILEEIESKFQKWEYWFQLLNEWKNDKVENPTGESHITLRKIYKGYKLGFWYDNEKTKKERLQNVYPDRYKKLVEYGIRWRETTRPRVTILEGLREKLLLMKNYSDLNGTANIPKRLVTANKLGHVGWEKKLAQYVNHNFKRFLNQIKSDASLTYVDEGVEMRISDFLININYNEEKKTRVRVQRMIDRLNSEKLKDPSFNEIKFNQLCLKDTKLSQLTNYLRNYYSGVRPPGREYFKENDIENLIAAGFEFRTRGFDFNTMLQSLKDFIETNKRLPKQFPQKLFPDIDSDTRTNEVTLWTWMYDQQRIDCNLLPEQKQLLIDLGVKFKPKRMVESRRKKWMEKYEVLALAKNDYPSFTIPIADKRFGRLKDWVRDQRRYCLEDWQKELLTKIGFFDNVEITEDDKILRTEMTPQ